MKKLIVIMVLAALLGILAVGCSSDEEKDKGVLVFYTLEVGQPV